ncbi:MAG TPA: dihydrofolate reductase family protein [Bradyrhizobium sp.]|nr:dihydrofolate reductase family protein [Bradyrhizobium sp.]
MPKLVVYNSVSLDGYFTDTHGDMSWAHKRDPEWQAFVSENASGGGQLLFGRVTYDLMASFWPTPLAAQSNPIVVERMNNMPKFVFSTTLDKASWNNTTLLKGDLPAQVRRLKRQPGPNIVVVGSGSIVAQLAAAGLVDEYQIVLNPLVVGDGRTLFEGVKKKLPMKLARSRAFGNGNVVLFYEPAA